MRSDAVQGGRALLVLCLRAEQDGVDQFRRIRAHFEPVGDAPSADFVGLHRGREFSPPQRHGRYPCGAATGARTLKTPPHRQDTWPGNITTAAARGLRGQWIRCSRSTNGYIEKPIEPETFVRQIAVYLA